MKKKVLIIFLTFLSILVLVGLGFGGYYVYNNYISPQEEEESENNDEADDLDVEEVAEETEVEEDDFATQSIPELSLTSGYDDTICSWELMGTSDGSTIPANVSDYVYEVTCVVNNVEGIGKIIINPMMTGGGYGLFAIDMADGLYYEANDVILDRDDYITSSVVQISEEPWTKRVFEYSGTIGYFNEVWYYPTDPNFAIMFGFDWNDFDVIMGYEIMITTTYSEPDVIQIQTALDQIFESLN